MAEVILGARLAEHGIDATVSSVGTLGWAERGATPLAVEVMGEMGLDLGAHRSRRIEPGHLDVDLVLAMTRDHAGAAIARDQTIRSCVFLPAELLRLLRGVVGEGVPVEKNVTERIRVLGNARTSQILGRATDEVPDPAGESIEVYRATAARLDRELTALAAALAA